MLSLAIDNTNTPNWANSSLHHLVPTRGDDVAMASSQDEGATGRQPVDTLRAGRGRPGVGVTAGETATHSNSRSSSRANAGDGHPLPVVASTPFNSTGATVVSGSAACSAVCATGAHYTRPAPFDGSGDEPSVPSFADGGAKMLDGCSRLAGRADAASEGSHAQAKQVATYSTWSPWSVCKGSI